MSSLSVAFTAISAVANCLRIHGRARFGSFASTGAKRSPAAPEVPTIAQSAIPGYVVEPVETPSKIVQKINGDCAKALVEPALVEKLARNASTVESSSPAERAKSLKADTERWESAYTSRAALRHLRRLKHPIKVAPQLFQHFLALPDLVADRSSIVAAV